MGEPLRFTKWGIVSGLFWVPGGESFANVCIIIYYASHEKHTTYHVNVSTTIC